jgi:HlyD family secretion protein
MPSEALQSWARVRRSRLWVAILASALALALVGGVAWAIAGWARSASELAGIERFTVVPRSFAVVLKEKGELKASRSADVVSEVEGRSTIIYLIPEGTTVKEGDLLVELASDKIEDRIQQDELKEANAIMAYEAAGTELEIQRDKNASDIRKAKLEIELNQLALEKYVKGDWEQSLKDAQIEIERALIALERRTEDYESAKRLIARDFITKAEYEEDEFDFKRAQWDLDKAKKALEVLTKYTHKADLRRRQSDFEEALKEHDRIVKNAEAVALRKSRSLQGKKKELELIQDQLAKLRSQKEKCRILAPTQGFVVYYSGGGRHFMRGDNQIKEGATVHERQILLSLPDTSAMVVVVRVHEAKTDKLSVGQRAEVKVEGLPEQRFTGRVAKIAALADSQNRWLNPDLKEYETEIALDPTDAPLKPGVTAYVEILVQAVQNKLAVPVQTVYTKGGRRYVFERGSRKAVPVEIRLGAIGTEWAEVSDGLSGGEQILLAFSDEHRRLVPDLPATNKRKGFSRGDPDVRRDAMRRGAAPDRHGMNTPRGAHPKGVHRGDKVRGKTASRTVKAP